MCDEILLSIIVPVYNVAPWLPRCLDSILEQTYDNLEVIVIDDGSTDASPQIIDQYAQNHNVIKAIHQNNQGLVAVRERGIREAKGDYIGFVDGDDEIIPEMYERLVNNALAYNAQISQCGIMCYYADGRKVPLYGTNRLAVYNRQEGCAALLRGLEMEPSLCNKIYHDSILKDSCLDNSIINNEDMLRNIVLFSRADCSVLEDFCGYLYRRRSESMSFHKDSVDIVRNILMARKKIAKYVSDDIKEIALENYVQGAMRGYNILLNKHSKEAVELKKNCKEIIRIYGLKNNELSQKDKTRAWLMIYTPTIYDIVERIHLRNRSRRRLRE